MRRPGASPSSRASAWTSLVLATLACLPLLAAAPAPGGWTMFRGDAQLTGRAASDLPRDPKPLWTFESGKGFSSTAAIAFEAGRGTVYVGGLDGTFYALDLATGKPRWTYKASDEIKSSPAVAGGTVYFGDEKGAFHALDARTGQRRWVFQAGAGITSSANFAPGCVLFGSYDRNLYCLAPADGKVVWQLTTEGYVHGTPAVVGDTVVVSGCDGYLRVVRAKDGKELGSVPLGGYVGASPAVAGGRVFVGNFENEFLAVDLKNPAAPKVAWRYEHPVRKFPFYSSAAARDGLVVVGGRDKLIHALDPASGKALWTWSARAAVDASPALVGDRIVAADKSGVVFALDARTGKPVWSFEAGGPIEASPAIGGGRLVVGTADGVLYCFGARSSATSRRDR